MDRLHLDLSIVKKEHNLDDYGHSNGNILDNIISEDDFHQQFGASHSNPTVPNSDEVDVSVDWLSSFFEEPNNTTCYTFSPSLSATSEPVDAGLKQGAGLLDDPSCCNVQTGFVSFPEDSSHDLARHDLSMKSNSFARNPFLSQLEGVSSIAETEKQPQETETLRHLSNLKVLNRAQFLIKKRQHFPTKKESSDNLKASTTQRESGMEQLLESDMLGTDIFTIPIKSEAETTDSDSGYDSNSRSPDCVSPSSDGPCDVIVPGDLSPAEKDRFHDDNQPHERSPFYLTDEERRTLVTEGLPVPKGLPLSKTEERALKKVRRKIKNKISAQESRRKKKEYMESLERKIDGCNSENVELKKNMEKLENTNRSLLLQLQKLQQFVATKVSRSQTSSETQTIDIVM